MATVTHNLLVSDGGLFTVDFDYDDVTMRIISIAVVNNTDRTITVTATSTSNGRNYTLPFVPGSNEVFNIPAGAANRLDLSVTPSGKLDGVEWSSF